MPPGTKLPYGPRCSKGGHSITSSVPFLSPRSAQPRSFARVGLRNLLPTLVGHAPEAVTDQEFEEHLASESADGQLALAFALLPRDFKRRPTE